jgi:ribonuclease HII
MRSPILDLLRIREDNMVEIGARRSPLRKALKLEALRKKQDTIRAKIAKMEAREKFAARKADSRLKTIVGAAIIANVQRNPETRAWLMAVLDGSVTARKDREFLKVQNWL